MLDGEVGTVSPTVVSRKPVERGSVVKPRPNDSRVGVFGLRRHEKEHPTYLGHLFSSPKKDRTWTLAVQGNVMEV